MISAKNEYFPPLRVGKYSFFANHKMCTCPYLNTRGRSPPGPPPTPTVFVFFAMIGSRRIPGGVPPPDPPRIRGSFKNGRQPVPNSASITTPHRRHNLPNGRSFFHRCSPCPPVVDHLSWYTCNEQNSYFSSFLGSLHLPWWVCQPNIGVIRHWQGSLPLRLAHLCRPTPRSILGGSPFSVVAVYISTTC